MREEEKDRINEINRSEAAFLNFGDVSISTDLYEHAKLVDFFASNYGLGGCKSLTEFWKMIDEEDPEKLDLLRIAINARVLAQSGDVDEEGYKRAKQIARPRVAKKTNFSKEARVVSDENVMAEFLIHMGSDQKDVDEALVKCKKRKINKQVDLRDINSENLCKEDFDLKDALNRVNEANKGAGNFQVSIHTLHGR